MTTYKVWNGTSWEYIDNQNYDARYLLRSELGAAEGASSLDSSGHIPTEQLPSSITGAVSYQGTFDPTSGAPTPAAQGYYYVSDGVGTIDTTSFATGDWLVYRDDTNWDKIGNSSTVVTWANITDKPSTFTPTSHGNEAHDVTYAVTSDITYETLNTNGDVGTSAGQLAIGNHTHSDLQPLDGDLTAIAGLSGSAGLLRKTASNTWTLDTNTYLTELSTVGNATNWDTASRPSFTGNALKVLRLNATGDAFEFATVSATVDIHGTDSTSEFTTGDEVLIYDTSLGENRKILRGNFFNGLEGEYISIHGTTEETTPATNMEVLVYDPSVPANRRMTRANFLDGISAVGAFTDLTDTPASYEGCDETYYVRVNAASNALEFATVPSSYTLPTASADTLGGVKIGSGITITDGVISAASGGGLTWTEVTGTSQAAAVDNGYIANNSSLVTVTLPSTCAVGKTIRVVGKGAGLWKIAQNAGQQIIFGNKNTTIGTSGYIASLYKYDSVELLCITADTVFSVTYAVGDLDVV